VSQNQNIVEFFDKSTLCYIHSVDEQIKTCPQFQKVESVTPFSRRCFTYFSRLFGNNVWIDKEYGKVKYIIFLIQNEINTFASIHPNNTSPHFFNQNIEIINYSHNVIGYSTIFEKLLPSPYQTDCQEYENFVNFSNDYRSKEDCIVRNLERLELKKCGCNRRWSYWARSFQNNRNICQKHIECKLDLMKEVKSLEKYCKENCLKEHIKSSRISSVHTKGLEKMKSKVFAIIINWLKYGILITNLPKMTFTEYFCSIGGLASMWFGICISALIMHSFKKLNYLTNFIIELLERIAKNISLSSTEYFKWFEKISKIICAGLMLQQIIIVINIYCTFDTITRWDVRQIKFFPNVKINKQQELTNWDKLMKIYPELKEEIAFTGNNSLQAEWDGRETELQYLYNKYLFKLLTDGKLEEIREIVETNRILISCKITVDQKIIDCPITTGIEKFNKELEVISLLNSTNFENDIRIDKNRIERITLTFRGFKILTIKLFRYHSFSINSLFVLSLEANARTRFSYSPYKTNRISSYDNECISNIKSSEFGEQYFDFCLKDCFTEKMIQIYGCIAVNITRFEFYFDRDLLNKNLSFCNESIIPSIDLLNKLDDKCRKVCIEKCEVINFDSYFEISDRGSNETILEIISNKSPRIEYTETLKTDLNRLVYNIGGVLGLWFGLSPVVFVDLLSLYLPQLYLKLKSYFSLSIKFSKILGLYSIRLSHLSLNYVIRLLLIFKDYFSLLLNWINDWFISHQNI
jgi:hypothetical protein